MMLCSRQTPLDGLAVREWFSRVEWQQRLLEGKEKYFGVFMIMTRRERYYILACLGLHRYVSCSGEDRVVLKKSCRANK